MLIHTQSHSCHVHSVRLAACVQAHAHSYLLSQLCMSLKLCLSGQKNSHLSSSPYTTVSHLCHNFGGLTLSVKSPLSPMRITKADATRSSSLSPTEHLGRKDLGLVIILSPSLDTQYGKLTK